MTAFTCVKILLEKSRGVMTRSTMSCSCTEDRLGHSNQDNGATQPLTRACELTEVPPLPVISESPSPPECFCRSSNSKSAIECWLDSTSASRVHPIQPGHEASNSLQQPLGKSMYSNKRKRSYSRDDATAVTDIRSAHQPLMKQRLTQYLSAMKSEVGVSCCPVF